MLAPASKAAPLETPGAHRHHCGTSCTTDRSDKKCPDFLPELWCGVRLLLAAERRERSRRQEQDRDDVPSRRESVMQFFRCARERYIGEGAFVVREHGISASPMTISLVTFLFGNKKVTPITEQNRVTN